MHIIKHSHQRRSKESTIQSRAYKYSASQYSVVDTEQQNSILTKNTFALELFSGSAQHVSFRIVIGPCHVPRRIYRDYNQHDNDPSSECSSAISHLCPVCLSLHYQLHLIFTLSKRFPRRRALHDSEPKFLVVVWVEEEFPNVNQKRTKRCVKKTKGP